MAAVTDVGVLGGAFDPPHNGHVVLARAGSDRFELDRLLIRVVEKPGHKQVETDPQVRLHLAELAFSPLGETELALDRHARTVDSLEALGLDDPVFLIGADEFAFFLGWTRPERVLELARLGVATRPGYPPEVLDAVLMRLAFPERVVFFPIDPLEISSSEIRARVASGESIEGLVPPAVVTEIERLGLYCEI
ncbi:MAG: nicotinate-nicotinamide nucleotide adenylyltransferase [Gaiella sp.]